MTKTFDVSATTSVDSTTDAISTIGDAATTQGVRGSRPGPSLGQHPGQLRKRRLTARYHGRSVIFIVSSLLYCTAWPRFYPPPAYHIITAHRLYRGIPLPRAPPDLFLSFSSLTA